MATTGEEDGDDMGKARKKAALSGARSGRGFRYQDSVAAALAIIGHVEGAPWTISPEADEDITITTGDGQVIEVQAKSRRGQKADLTAADVMRTLADVWARQVDRLADENVRVCLVLDRTPTGCEPTGLAASLIDGASLSTSALAAVATKAGRTTDDLLARSHLLVNVSPAVFARQLLEQHLGVLPIEAEVLFRQILARVGELVDRRADGHPPGTISPNEIARLLEEAQRVVNIASIEAPLRAGICEYVDFETPVHDPAFFLGVDVVPGHIAAGLVTERPVEVERCLETIERTRTAVVTGPSGVGKTAVAYLAAHSTRDLVRWIRVLEAGSVFDLIKLAEALRASRHAPVGFLVDDIGQMDASMWDTLVQRAREHEGVYVLGTTREEDLDLLAEAPESVVLRPGLDDTLAESIWRHLVDEGATTAGSWVEALDLSNGLTLEFVHHLTTGVRLPETIARQVKQRRREHRDHELQLLRVASLAATSGAVVDLRRFASEFGVTDEDVQRALVRVVDEHLVRSVGPTEIAGLHRLRSEALLEATHVAPPPSLGETAVAVLRCTSSADLPELTSILLTRRLLTLPEIYDALTSRLTRDATPATLCRCLDALRLTAFREYVDAARTVFNSNDVPLALRHTGVGLAMIQDRGLNDAFEPRLAAALPALRGLQPHDLRSAWLQHVPNDVLTQSSMCSSTEDGIALLLALAGLPGAKDLGLVVVDQTPLPSGAEVTARFLDAARLAGAAVTSAAIAAVGGTDGLIVLAREQPWVTHLDVIQEWTDEGALQTVLEFHLLCVEGGLDHDVHGAVVDLCRLYMALFPDVDAVAGKAVDGSGELVGFRGHHVADKKIPRSNLPSLPEVRWNRELLNGFADAGSESRTERLVVEARLLERATAASVEAADRWVAGHGLASTLTAELGEITEVAGNVWKRERASVDPSVKGEALPDIGDLASALKLLCGNALQRLFASANMGLAAFLWDTVRKDLLKTVGVGYWRLLGTDLDEQVMDLVTLVEQLHSVLGLRLREEAGSEIVWGARGPDKTLAQAARAADEAHAAHLETNVRSAVKALRALGFVAAPAGVEPDKRQSLIWPAEEIVITVDVNSLYSWLMAAQLILEAVSTEFDQLREVVVIPRRSGHLVPGMAQRAAKTSDGLFFPANEQAERFVSNGGEPTLTGELGVTIMRVLALDAATEGISRLMDHRALLAVETEALARIEDEMSAGVEQLQERIASDQTGLLDELLGAFLAEVGESPASLTLTAISSGDADEVLGLLAVLQAAEIELEQEPENAVTELVRLNHEAEVGAANPAVADLPGIPTDCFEVIEAVDGLIEELADCGTIDQLIAAVKAAADAGKLPGVVADHVQAWNGFKADSSASTSAAEYDAFRRQYQHDWVRAGLAAMVSDEPGTAKQHKPGRNEPCPCGSGRKYKQCHGR